MKKTNSVDEMANDEKIMQWFYEHDLQWQNDMMEDFNSSKETEFISFLKNRFSFLNSPDY